MSLVKRNLVIKITNTQPAFTCLKSTTETPEQGTNHAYRQLYRHQHDANGVALASSLPTQNTPHTLLQCIHCQLKLILSSYQTAIMEKSCTVDVISLVILTCNEKLQQRAQLVEHFIRFCSRLISHNTKSIPDLKY